MSGTIYDSFVKDINVSEHETQQTTAKYIDSQVEKEQEEKETEKFLSEKTEMKEGFKENFESEGVTGEKPKETFKENFESEAVTEEKPKETFKENIESEAVTEERSKKTFQENFESEVVTEEKPKENFKEIPTETITASEEKTETKEIDENKNYQVSENETKIHEKEDESHKTDFPNENKSSKESETYFKCRISTYEHHRQTLESFEFGKEVLELTEYLINLHKNLRWDENVKIKALLGTWRKIKNGQEITEEILPEQNEITHFNSEEYSKKIENISISLKKLEFGKEIESLNKELILRIQMLQEIEMIKIQILEKNIKNYQEKPDYFKQIYQKNPVETENEYDKMINCLSESVRKEEREEEIETGKNEIDLVRNTTDEIYESVAYQGNLCHTKSVIFTEENNVEEEGKENNEEKRIVEEEEKEVEDTNQCNRGTIYHSLEYQENRENSNILSHLTYEDLKENGFKFQAKFNNPDSFHEHFKCLTGVSKETSAIILCCTFHEVCKLCLRNYIQFKHNNDKYAMLFDVNICPFCGEESKVDETHDILRNIFGADYIQEIMDSSPEEERKKASYRETITSRNEESDYDNREEERKDLEDYGSERRDLENEEQDNRNDLN